MNDSVNPTDTFTYDKAALKAEADKYGLAVNAAQFQQLLTALYQHDNSLASRESESDPLKCSNEMTEMATKLFLLFKDAKKAINYLNRHKHSLQKQHESDGFDPPTDAEVVASACNFNIPADFDAKMWRTYFDKQPPSNTSDMQFVLLSHGDIVADMLADEEKLKELKQKYCDYLKETKPEQLKFLAKVIFKESGTDFFNRLMADKNARQILIEQVAFKHYDITNIESMSPFFKEHPEIVQQAAAIFFQHNIDKEYFDEYLELKPANHDEKSPHAMPDITVTGEEIGLTGRFAKYQIKPLAQSDPRAALLGYYSGSCQSIDDNAWECVQSGIQSDSQGFYVLEDDKGNIVAQCWAWRSKVNESEDIIIFDSIESEIIHRTKHETVISDFFMALAQKMVNDAQEELICVGIGGNTPAVFEIEFLHEDAVLKPMDSKTPEYGDSDQQSMLAISSEEKNQELLLNYKKLKAIINNDHEALAKLIDEKNVKIEMDDFYQAGELNHQAVHQVLCEKSRDKNNLFNPDNFESPLLCAVRHQQYETAKRLIESGADVNETSTLFDENSALIKAIQLGDTDIVKLLLEKNADPNITAPKMENMTPLMMAAKKGDLDCVSLLLKHGADVTLEDEQGLTALDYVFSSENSIDEQMMLAETLIKNGSETTALFHEKKREAFEQYHRSLCQAITDNDLTKAEELLKKGVNPNYASSPRDKINGRDYFYPTPLIYAVIAKNYDAIGLLIKYGADINHASNRGRSEKPLIVAIDNGNIEMMNYLVQLGAELNGDSHLTDPLFLATVVALHRKESKEEMLRAIETLVSCGANPYKPITMRGYRQESVATFICWRHKDRHQPITSIFKHYLWQQKQQKKISKEKTSSPRMNVLKMAVALRYSEVKSALDKCKQFIDGYTCKNRSEKLLINKLQKCLNDYQTKDTLEPHKAIEKIVKLLSSKLAKSSGLFAESTDQNKSLAEAVLSEMGLQRQQRATKRVSLTNDLPNPQPEKRRHQIKTKP